MHAVPAFECPLLPGRDHPELRATVRRWLIAHLPEAADTSVYDPFEYHRRGVDARPWMRTLADAGYAAPTWPVEYGGGGYTRSEAMAVQEELVAAGAPPHLDVIGTGIVGPMLLELASEEQKRRWLPACVRGEAIWCQLFSEPGCGSDLGSMLTVARRVDDGYLVTGQKVWTSNADRARWGLLVTKLEGADAFVALAIDMSRPEVTVRPLMQPHGEATFSEVFMEDVWVPEGDRVGGEQDGWRVAIATLLAERAAIGGFQFGLTGPLLRLAAAIGAGDVAAEGRGDALHAFCDGLVHSLYVRRMALAEGDAAGPPAGTQWFPVKVALARLNQRITDQIWRSLGAGASVGLTSPEVRAMLRSRANTIEGGTSEILMTNIGERLLGLPREPRNR